MSRSAENRFADMITAIDRCLAYRPFVTVEDPTHAKMAQDAILRNLTVIGEAVRAIPAEVVSGTSGIPWRMIRALRNIVVHEYFRVDADVISRVLDNDLPSVSSLLLNLAWCQHLAKTKRHSEAWWSELDVDGNERWYWTDSAYYLSWINNAFGESAAEREKTRYLTQLEADLEELVNTPWITAYGPESYRDADSDYHYFNEASIDLGSSERYDQLWDYYLLLWKEYNKTPSIAKP